MVDQAAIPGFKFLFGFKLNTQRKNATNKSPNSPYPSERIRNEGCWLFSDRLFGGVEFRPVPDWKPSAVFNRSCLFRGKIFNILILAKRYFSFLTNGLAAVVSMLFEGAFIRV